mgnify:CR=1 FL=1
MDTTLPAVINGIANMLVEHGRKIICKYGNIMISNNRLVCKEVPSEGDSDKFLVISITGTAVIITTVHAGEVGFIHVDYDNDTIEFIKNGELCAIHIDLNYKMIGTEIHDDGYDWHRFKIIKQVDQKKLPSKFI